MHRFDCIYMYIKLQLEHFNALLARLQYIYVYIWNVGSFLFVSAIYTCMYPWLYMYIHP